MIRRTYKIDVQVIETWTVTVEVEKVRGRDYLLEAYDGALAAYDAGNRGELRHRTRAAVSGSHDLVSEVEDPTIEFKNLAPAGSRYGWLITRDALFDEGDEPEDVDGLINEAGVHGPSDAVLTHEQIREHGVEFQMLDDDGTLYYEGKIAWAADYEDGSGFEPLEDFGRANAGCTEIRYRDTDGEWRTL